MPANILSATVHGIDARIITVETDIAHGLHCFTIVGLPDKSVDESKDRINAALKNSGFVYPKKTNQKIVVNLAPADIKKEGSAYDLPIAISYLCASDQLRCDTASTLFLGELSLDGSVRPIRGALAIVAHAKQKGISAVVLPAQNAREAALISGITLVPIASIAECIAYLTDGMIPDMPNNTATTECADDADAFDLSHIKGQEQAKRALTIAAAGGHNVLLSGPPGSGKTMLAKAAVSILPPMSEEEMIETTKIYGVAGALGEHAAVVTRRPFRAPHHSASDVALIGGGKYAQLGEITLAHNGVLFLDEFPEFPRNVIEALRQPLEEKTITISRAHGTFTYPAHIILIATKNPCPCGYYRSAQRDCTCPMSSVIAYQKKVSGPIADRIDIHVEVPAVAHERLAERTEGNESAEIQKHVAAARRIQAERFTHDGIRLNADMSPKHIATHCPLDVPSQTTLKNAMDKMRFSARAYHKIIKLARTIADLEKAPDIRAHHIAEALQYQNRN